MEDGAALDNDILIKCSCYGLLDEIAAGLTANEIGILGSAPYVVRHRIRNSSEIKDRPSAMARFEAFLSKASLLEPTVSEVMLATTLEEVASVHGLQLDTGESQLCAIVLVRSLRFLVTGDKRAIQSLENLLPHVGELGSLRKKVACLEQLLVGVTNALGASGTRAYVCGEPSVDKALSICFECKGKEEPGFSPVGLESYINDIRTRAPEMLCPTDILFGV